MHNVVHQERRRLQRLPSESLLVSVRKKGYLTRIQGQCLNFNRYGLALILPVSLPKDRVITLSLRLPELQVGPVIGVVHSCIKFEEAYRCGIQFRTGSPLQPDQADVERGLAMLESQFTAVQG
ncbi:MAG: hypothetical protein HN856_13130 [Gammaproteobacteria bacterium]|nr:hypothetical protein [Gammaproteobacteria bacterium]